MTQSNLIPISPRAQAIKPSATLSVSARAAELRASGKQVLNFAAGEPDFKSPEPVRVAGSEFILNNPVRYAPVGGLPALRDAVAKELSEYHGRDFTRANILVSCGAKHSLANLFLTVVSPGEEVIIPAPYWVSYPDMVGLAEGKSVFVKTDREDGFRLRPERLGEVAGPQTRLLILNSPSNPTGAGYTAEQVKALGEVLAKKAPNAWIVTDDIYRHLVYDGYTHASAFRALEGITERILVIDGVSKSHAMTGFRIGYMAVPAEIASAASRIQGQMTSGAATPSQHAALAALTDPACAKAVADMREAFTRRRRLVLDGLAKVPGAVTPAPDGAFYVFTDISAHVGPGSQFADDIALATWLLDEKLVATVPGTAFGAPGHLRMSYATDDDSLREGLGRMEEAFSGLPTAKG